MDVGCIPFLHSGSEVLGDLHRFFLGRHAGDSLDLDEDGYARVHDADILAARPGIPGSLRLGVDVVDVRETDELQRLNDGFDERGAGSGQEVVEESVRRTLSLDEFLKLPYSLAGGFLNRADFASKPGDTRDFVLGPSCP